MDECGCCKAALPALNGAKCGAVLVSFMLIEKDKKPPTIPLSDVSLIAPVTCMDKVLCIGLCIIQYYTHDAIFSRLRASLEARCTAVVARRDGADPVAVLAALPALYGARCSANCQEY